jgi:NitT/TauT family transport system permease protein
MAILIILLSWEMAVRSGLLDTQFLVSVSEALAAGWRLVVSGRFWGAAWVSLIEFFWGMLVGILVGVPLGFVMAKSRAVDRLLSSTVWAVYSVPRTAFVPLMLVWFGVGLTSKTAFVFLGAVFPLIANSYLAVRETDRYALRAARSFSATRVETVMKVTLPFSIPYVIAGLRLAAGRAIIGVIIAELFVSTEGIGHLLRVAGLSLDTAMIFFLFLLVGAFGITVSQSLIWLERKVAGWRHASGVK